MPDTSRLDPYRARFLELRNQLVPILGAKTVDLIIERGTVEIASSYPEMALIRVTADGIDLAPLNAPMGPKSDEEIRVAFDALNGVVLLILARLLGKEVAARMVQNDSTGGQRRGAG